MSNSSISIRLVIGSALAVGMAPGALFPSKVDARVRGPRTDSISYACGQLQDQYDQAVRDLERASHGSQAEYDAALAVLQSIIRQWNDGPCSSHFGSLIYRKVPGVNQAGSQGQQGQPTLAPIRRTSSSPKRGEVKSVGPMHSVLKKS